MLTSTRVSTLGDLTRKNKVGWRYTLQLCCPETEHSTGKHPAKPALKKRMK